MEYFVTGYLVLLFAVCGWLMWRLRRSGIGAGAAGALYELLDDDRRKAVEIIVERKTTEQEPETRDGNLPDLEK